MGYSTTFKGELKFTYELKAKELAKLNGILGEDCRDHKDWDADGLYHVDLELVDDFSGLKWSGAEKTYDLDKIVNVIIKEMRKQFPNFGLTGQLGAQGEEAEDRWTFVIGDDGFAHKKKIVIVGQRVQCPSCEHKFVL